MRKPPIPVNRRVYLQSLSAAAIGTWLAGCGGGGAAPAAQVEGVTGSLNVSQIGGSQLKVFSVFDGLAEVVNGSFTTKVSEDMLQTLLVSDGNEKLRAMTIHISGKPLAVDASSTAVAIVFLTPGISTLDKTAGAARVLAIQAAAGFAAFLQLLQAAMLTQDLPTALAVPAIRAARDVVVQQVTAWIEAQALESPQEVVNQSQSDGYLVVKKDDTSTNTELKIQLSNEGFRFVKVVRKEEFNGLNQLAVPVLQGSPTKNSIIGGRGGASIAGFVSLAFGGALGAPGGATDTIDQSLHKADRLTYYVRGLGNPLHANDEAFPNDVQSVMEAEGGLHLGMTVFFYFLLPVVEPILAAFTGITAEEALSKVGKALGPAFTGGAAEAGFISTATALQAGDQTGFLVALGDLIIGLTPIVLRALAATFAQLLPGVVLIELALTLIGAFIATVNFSIAGVAFFRTPQRANAELVLGAPIHFLDHLIAQDQAYSNALVYLTADGSLIYGWFAQNGNSDRRINRLRIPPLGSPYQPEVTYDLSDEVRIVEANKNGEIAAQQSLFTRNGNISGPTTQKFFLYTLPNGGSLNPVQIGEVVYTYRDYVTNTTAPNDDANFQTFAISSTGAVAGIYDEFFSWSAFDGVLFRPSHLQQVWWIPKGGSLIKKAAHRELLAAIASAYPLGGSKVRAEAGKLKVFDLNASGVLLMGVRIWGNDENNRNFTEHVGATFNMVTGRINILFRTEEAGAVDAFAMRTGKINDKGQVALSRAEVGIFFGEFYNGAGATGEPIPTAIGFKNRFYVNDLTSDGDVGGFEQIFNTPGVTGKAGIWKAASVLGEVVDVHAKLAGPTVAQPYSSSIARLGDDGTIVGRVITQRLTNPDLPAGFDNPPVDVLRDFVIQATPAN